LIPTCQTLRKTFTLSFMEDFRLNVSIEAFLRSCKIDHYSLIPLSGDGSLRRFYRVFSEKGSSKILILPQPGEFGLKEAASYAAIGQYLLGQGLPVPEIYAHEPTTGFLLVEDLGDTRLQDLPPEERFFLYQEVIKVLVEFQGAARSFDPKICLETSYYDLDLMWKREALYFVDSFLRGHFGLEPPMTLIDELRLLCQEAFRSFTDTVLLHRDFQSRNIMIKDGKPYLIDFQGARLGPPGYDLASLLFDPYVGLEGQERFRLYSLYLDCSGRGEEGFEREFRYLLLFRHLQMLGAFAKLSSLGKEWFASYIPTALSSLRRIVVSYFSEYTALMDVLAQLP